MGIQCVCDGEDGRRWPIEHDLHTAVEFLQSHWDEEGAYWSHDGRHIQLKV